MKKLLTCALAWTGITLSQAQVVTQTLNFTGTVQTYTVPACVNVISFTCFGAQGGAGTTSPNGASGGFGGLGAMVYGTTTVTPGSVIYINVGGTGTGSLGGFNGGGNGAIGNSGGGGGATDIRIGGNATANRVLVAGGGGGGGNAGCYSSTVSGGAGGFGGGGNGSAGVISIAGGPGAGGSGVNPGLPGNGCSGFLGLAGTSGILAVGGNGGNGPNVCGIYSSGGGGGGGYYGGGGGGGGSAGTSSCTLNDQGGGGGGAGGTNYFDPAFTATVVNNSVQAGNGRVILSFAPSPLTLTFTPLTPTVCLNSTVTLNVSGASNYTWSTGSNTFSTSVSPTINTTYTVNGVTNGTLVTCTGTGTISVTVYSLPVISVNSGTNCYGANFTLTPNGASTYTFQGGSAVVSPTSNTTYTVRGTNALGCRSASFATASVTVIPAPVITVNSGTVCPGNPFTLTPSGATTYTYLNGGPVISPTIAGTYSVSGTSSLGCVSQTPAVASISLAPVPIVGVNSGTICQGTSFTLVPFGAISYTYLNGGPVVSPSVTTTYSVLGSNAEGCLGAFHGLAEVKVFPGPTVTVNGGAICPGDVFTMMAQGAVSYTYEGGNPSVSPLTTTSYTVAGTNTLGCESVVPGVATVTVLPGPSVLIIGASTVCAGQSLTLSALGATNYTWSTGSNSTAIVVSPQASTIYSLSGVAPGKICPGKDTLSITVFTCTVLRSMDEALNGLLLYPNPADNRLTVELPNTLPKHVSVSDATGRKITELDSSEEKFDLDLGALSPGLYLVRVDCDGGSATVRVVRQ